MKKNGLDVASYIYDESGLRLKKQGKDKSVYYVFDTGGNVLYEQENRDYLEYVYVLGKHFARVDGNLDNSIRKKYFYHTDHLGSTVAVTDEAGQTVWTSEYTPFGGKHSTEGKFAHAVKFTGKDLDEDIGMYYFNARWYDQEIGRFISVDPIKDGANWYTYTKNNPIILIDPTGLKAALEVHGLNSSASMWEQLNEFLLKQGKYQMGGNISIDKESNLSFQNKGLFKVKEWQDIEEEMKGMTVEQQMNHLKEKIKIRVSEFDKQGKDVLFTIEYAGGEGDYSNQGDFRKQGAKLKEAIDLVNPEGQKVDVIGHSMGALATASYISGISGVEYEKDINKFIAVGAPFKGCSLAKLAYDIKGKIDINVPSIEQIYNSWLSKNPWWPGVDANPLVDTSIPAPRAEYGPAYALLMPNSEGIKQLQDAWNRNYQSFGVNFYSMQGIFGDGVVSRGSSTSLKGSNNIMMERFSFHTNQANNLYWQSYIWGLLQH